MNDAYLISKVSFFSYSLKKKFSCIYQPKYYALYLNLVSISGITSSKNFGRKLENAVFLKIYSQEKEISYYSEKNEVDFIFGQTAINVTSGDKIPEREILGLIEFKKKHKEFNLILINKDINEERVIKKIKYKLFLYEK